MRLWAPLLAGNHPLVGPMNYTWYGVFGRWRPLVLVGWGRTKMTVAVRLERRLGPRDMCLLMLPVRRMRSSTAAPIAAEQFQGHQYSGLRRWCFFILVNSICLRVEDPGSVLYATSIFMPSSLSYSLNVLPVFVWQRMQFARSAIVTLNFRIL